MKSALKLWDHIGNVLDEVYEVMVKHLQAFKIAVHCWKSGDLVKLKVSPFKVSYYASIGMMAQLTFGSNGLT